MVLRPVSGLASGLHQRSAFPCSRTVADSDRVYSLTVAGAAPELRGSLAHRLPDSPLATNAPRAPEAWSAYAIAGVEVKLARFASLLW